MGRYILPKLLYVAVLLFSSGCEGLSPQNGWGDGPPPEKSWERVFMPYVANRLRETGIKCLEEEVSNSAEIRLWKGFSDIPLKGVILRESSGQWSGMYLSPHDPKSDSAASITTLSPPNSGWKPFIERLEGLDIYTIPDAVDIGADNSYPGAEAIVIEVRVNGKYRRYMYNGFHEIKALETEKVLSICSTFETEFMIDLACR